MTRILIIDDEPMYHKMIAHALHPLGVELDHAEDGVQGLNAANLIPPDLIICDVMMPKMTGYEVVRRLRRDPRFAHTPIMILTVQSDLEDKLEAFEAGADVHLSKPFIPAEFVAQVTVLLRRVELTKSIQVQRRTSDAHLIAVQSLRGGVGCSSMAINLAYGLNMIWKRPTLIVDLDLTAGQVALMLNASQKRTWVDIARFSPSELDLEALQTIIGSHESGLAYIAAPTLPTDGELLTPDLFKEAFALLRGQYDYIIFDLPHAFNEISVHVLDETDTIVLTMSPEMASVRASFAALNTYSRLGYPPEKVKLVLNWIFERKGLARKSIESALHRQVDLVVPFGQDMLVDAINYGQPLLSTKPNETISMLLEDFAFSLSSVEHRNNPPLSPSQAWLRASKRAKND
ncbi:MAG: response regulator [Chloroflexi bacterium]|nr:response regulator [Anaerolineaceae bacterium]NMB87459.1 response regulator [Chloroflexota bacterium]